MKLSLQQIKSVCFGALSVEESSDGFHFKKFTQKQIDAFFALNQGLGERSLSTTGVRLDFHTTSKHLAFCGVSGKKFELYIDNVFCQQFDCELCSRAEVDLISPLGARDEVRVTLILPSHKEGVLSSVELDDGATLVPHRFNRKLLFIGDSITQGWDSVYDSLSWAWRVMRFYDADGLIQGVGGSYYHESTFDHLHYDPDTVLVALGTNDFTHYKTKEDFRTHLCAHLDLIAEEYKACKLFILSPIWRDIGERPFGRVEELHDILVEEIERRGLRHVNGLSLVPHSASFMADRSVHPNDIGFGFFAENLLAQIVEK